jgi:serine/threonine-protein kinase
VDALGIDASKARDEARAARTDVAPFTQAAADARARFVEAHAEILTWEGRSAFQEPYQGLEDAYRKAAEATRDWLEARRIEKKAGEKAESRDREVADLEFQIHELRAALANLEQNVEHDKAKSEGRIADLDAQTEALQVELLTLATRFCAPLRRRPELGSLFRELEADAAA